MHKNWEIKTQPEFSKSRNKIDWLIQLVTNIRSAKVNLDVPPGSFIDISIETVSKKEQSFFIYLNYCNR